MSPHRFHGADASGQERLARGRSWTAGKTPGDERARRRARLQTPGGRERAWQRASLAAAHVAQQVRASAIADPAAAADAAWAANDLLAAAAHVVEGHRGGPLTGAADAYDRAARPGYGRAPAASPTGQGLRTAASLLMDLGAVLQPRSELGQVAVLLTQLAALARAVSQLREAQQRSAQAAAARLAAERLHHLRLSAPIPAHVAAASATVTAATWAGRPLSEWSSSIPTAQPTASRTAETTRSGPVQSSPRTRGP